MQQRSGGNRDNYSHATPRRDSRPILPRPSPDRVTWRILTARMKRASERKKYIVYGTARKDATIRGHARCSAREGVYVRVHSRSRERNRQSSRTASQPSADRREIITSFPRHGGSCSETNTRCCGNIRDVGPRRPLAFHHSASPSDRLP